MQYILCSAKDKGVACIGKQLSDALNSPSATWTDLALSLCGSPPEHGPPAGGGKGFAGPSVPFLIMQPVYFPACSTPASTSSRWGCAGQHASRRRLAAPASRSGHRALRGPQRPSSRQSFSKPACPLSPPFHVYYHRGPRQQTNRAMFNAEDLRPADQDPREFKEDVREAALLLSGALLLTIEFH